MLSTWSLMVCSLHPACFSQLLKPSRIGWLESWIARARCSYVSAGSASVIEPLSLDASGSWLLGPVVLMACTQESQSSAARDFLRFPRQWGEDGRRKPQPVQQA